MSTLGNAKIQENGTHPISSNLSKLGKSKITEIIKITKVFLNVSKLLQTNLNAGGHAKIKILETWKVEIKGFTEIPTILLDSQNLLKIFPTRGR